MGSPRRLLLTLFLQLLLRAGRDPLLVLYRECETDWSNLKRGRG